MPTTTPSAAVPAPTPRGGAVASDLLGPILAPPDAYFTFPAGLYGFETCCSFVLVPAGRSALYWLQSTEVSHLVFLVADPGHFFPHHTVDVPASELDVFAGPDAPDADFAAFVILTLGAEHGTATANLQAPVVFHAPSRTARQVVLDDGHQHVRVPLAIG